MLALPESKSLPADGFDMGGIAERGEARFNSTGIQPRSVLDWLVARGDFGVNVDHQKSRIYYGGFTSRRGMVQPINGSEIQNLTNVYELQFADNAFEKIKSDFTPKSPVRILPIEGNKVILSGFRRAHDEFLKLFRRLDQKSEDSKVRLDDVEGLAS